MIQNSTRTQRIKFHDHGTENTTYQSYDPAFCSDQVEGGVGEVESVG